MEKSATETESFLVTSLKKWSNKNLIWTSLLCAPARGVHFFACPKKRTKERHGCRSVAKIRTFFLSEKNSPSAQTAFRSSRKNARISLRLSAKCRKITLVIQTIFVGTYHGASSCDTIHYVAYRHRTHHGTSLRLSVINYSGLLSQAWSGGVLRSSRRKAAVIFSFGSFSFVSRQKKMNKPQAKLVTLWRIIQAVKVGYSLLNFYWP